MDAQLLWVCGEAAPHGSGGGGCSLDGGQEANERQEGARVPIFSLKA
jgi:hypothetical protein